jgi:hypothetical protein
MMTTGKRESERDLTDLVAEGLWQEESRRAGSRSRLVDWADAGDMAHEKYNGMAREAIRILKENGYRHG